MKFDKFETCVLIYIKTTVIYVILRILEYQSQISLTCPFPKPLNIHNNKTLYTASSYILDTLYQLILINSVGFVILTIKTHFQSFTAFLLTRVPLITVRGDFHDYPFQLQGDTPVRLVSQLTRDTPASFYCQFLYSCRQRRLKASYII